MTKFSNDKLSVFWSFIPSDEKGDAPVTYNELMFFWNCSARQARAILAELSAFDNGDDYILIRSSHDCGFYKTRDRVKIELYRREVYNRAMNTLKPLKKIRRVLHRSEQITIDDLLLFGEGVEPLNFD